MEYWDKLLDKNFRPRGRALEIFNKNYARVKRDEIKARRREHTAKKTAKKRTLGMLEEN